MIKYRIRFNKLRGHEGRGTVEHVWRIFEGETEYLVKHCKINVPSFSEKEEHSEDWNICCYGALRLDRETSTAIIE
jgi:hypothetical protein